MSNLSYITGKLNLDHFLRTRVVFAIDLLISVFASLLVIPFIYLLLHSYPIPFEGWIVWIVASVVGSGLSFLTFRVYRAIIRYSTLRELGRISVAVAGKDLILWVMMVVLTDLQPDSGLLLGMVLVDFMATLCALILARVLMVTVYDAIRRNASEEANVRRVLVYGIGDKSASAYMRLRHSKHYKVDGFITHGKLLKEHQLVGLPVYYFETASDVEALAKRTQLDGVLFPYVAMARTEQDRLIAFCQRAGLKTYITPGIDEITEAKAIGANVRKIKIEDLLSRPEIKIDMEEIVQNFSQKTVLVTGAAGSIGSELCRQLAIIGVKRLIIFDNAETPLHNIRLELQDRFPQLDFVPVIGDVRSTKRLEFLFHDYRPDIVFHAAAYKHVPLMEENPCEAVIVNVIGSKNVADKCVEYGVEKMVMVSTDKAVNPTNIMGCTKRLAEIYVQSLGLAIERGQVKGTTKFVTTRFGNVLGSNGSVIPRFSEQIANGGPITVTHPDIVRFFMTIPEACRLVMEAATFADATQIFVFDMGESVKIVKLAERMIHLAGLEAGRDIKIEFTGLRPGEKLYEEVLATKENTIPTQHSRIFVAKVREYDFSAVAAQTEQLYNHASLVTIPEMVILMKRMVPEFKSTHSQFEIYDQK